MKFILNHGFPKRCSQLKIWLVMRLTLLFTFAMSFTAIGAGYSQPAGMNFDFQNRKISQIIQTIENQTSYVFLYRDSDFDVSKELSFSVKDADIESLISELIKGQNVNYAVYDQQILITKKVALEKQKEQQPQKINGVVLDVSGQPVIGASVLVKGTTLGTVTDFNGEFSFTVPDGTQTLVVSFVGMESQEIMLNGQTTLNVVLTESMIGMDEVLIVAYGTAKKESLTGAISTISEKKIERRPVSSVASVLEGNVSGVQINNTYGEPGSDPTIRIRGFSSVNGSNSPLYVIDGVPFGGNISDLNPQDIDNISILKDAASSALYGNRASNGVILITTKKGRGHGVSMDVNINQGVYTRGIKEYERVGTNDFMEIMWKGYRNSLMSDQPEDYPTTELANLEASSTLIDTYLKYNIYNKADDALFNTDGKLVSGAKIHPGYDDLNWYKYVERLGYRQDYTVSGRGATDKSNYFFSAGYLDEKGYVKSSDFNRFTGRANLSITPRKWIETGINLSGSYQVANNTSGSASSSSSFVNPFYMARNMAPIYPVYFHDMGTGEYILDDSGNKIYDSGSEYSRPQSLDRHLVWENELNMDRTYRSTLQGMAYMDINFLKDFKFSIKGDLNVRASENQSYDNATIGNGAGNKGRAKRVFYRYKNYTFQQQLTWVKEFGDHNVDVFAGHENYNYNYAYTYGYKTTETFKGGPELINFTEITALDGYQNNYRTESYLSRVRYNYDNKYFGELSFRKDGSSRFYKDKRWGDFWSVGASWLISKEPFMLPYENTVDYLKLRVSYGEVGNDASVGYYGYMALYEMDQNANLGAVYKSQNEALDIKWETLSSFGIALEGNLLNRINFSIEYFDKRSNDLLFDVNLPLSAGATSGSSAEATISKNIGSVSNRGVEFSFDADLIKSRSLTWNVGASATLLKNKIITLPEENREKGIISGTKKYMEGHGIYDFWMYQFVGVDQMTGNSLYLPNLEDYTIGVEEGENEIPAEYLVLINDEYYTTYTTYAKKDWSGSAMPDVFGNISTSLNYKNFDFSVLCTYSVGGKTLDYSYQSLMSVSATPSAIHKDVLNSWDGIPAGMTADAANRISPNGIPVIDYFLSSKNNAGSSRFLQDASYLVVKNVGINYNFPKHVTSALDITGLSVGLSVENLFTFTSLKGMNPQQSFSGINDNAFVTARVFSLGINVKL